MIKKALTVAAAALSLQGAAMAQDTIKVGMMLVDAGPFAFLMRHFNEPAKLAIDKFNAEGGVLGKKFEIVTQSHPGTPAGALSAAQRLVQQEKVQFLTGFNTTAMNLAIAPRLPAMNALLLDANTTGDDLTGKNCSANFFRTSASDTMAANTLRSIVKESGAKTWNLIVPDYAMGHDFSKRFSALVTELGGTMQTTVFAPLGATDFGSHITQLAAKPADGLAVVVVGADAITFAKQQKQFGLFDKYKTVVSSNFTNEIVLQAQGDTTVGAYASVSYHHAMPGERNAAFVKAFEAAYKRKPNFIDADNYQVMEILRAAILKANSTDVNEVRKALKGLKTNTILGEVELRGQDHQLARPMAQVQVVKEGEGKGAIALRGLLTAQQALPAPNAECKM